MNEQQKGKRKRAVLYAVLAAGMWGTIGIFVNVLSGWGIPSLEMTVSRLVVSAAILGIFLVVTDQKKLKIRKSDLGWFCITGIGCILLFNVSYAVTIRKSSMAVSAVLLYTAPVFVTLISIPVFKEKLTIKKLLAVLLAITGCAFVSGVMAGVPAFPAEAFLWGFAAAMGYAFYSILASILLKTYHSLTVLFYVFLIAGLAGLGLADIGLMIAVVKQNPGAGVMILISALICNIFSYLSYNMALKYMEVSSVSVIASLEPAIASLLGVLVFGERMNGFGVAGVLCILAAVVVLS